MNNFIPVNVPILTGNEKKYVNECIDTGWISSEGPFVERFEAAFAARVGRKYGIAVSNGTAALDVAIAALGIEEGDEVILPTFTIISCAQAIVRSGAVPIVVDSDSNTWNMDVSEVEAKITSRTVAIMVVHIYGLPVDMGAIHKIAKKHNIKVIEDAAEAIGLEFKGQECGSFGDISTFSFYPNKHITTGEGGMVLTDDIDLAERCRKLRNLCFTPEKRFVHEELGWNYRLTNLQAAIGLAQVEKMDEHLDKKRQIGKRYNQLLNGMSGVQLPLPSIIGSENLYWIYGLVINEGLELTPSSVMKKLSNKGIGTRPFFWCMHEQPVFQRMGLFPNESYPNAEKLARRGFYVPSGLALTNHEIERVAISLKEIFNA